jgi:hypothetical protein
VALSWLAGVCSLLSSGAASWVGVGHTGSRSRTGSSQGYGACRAVTGQREGGWMVPGSAVAAGEGEWRQQQACVDMRSATGSVLGAGESPELYGRV